MREKGSLKQILVAYTPNPQVCPDTSGEALNWGACFTAFGVLVFGGFVTIGLFAIELLAKFLGLKQLERLLTWYGVGDMPEMPVIENQNFQRVLANKDAEIIAMKQKLQKLEDSGKSGWE